MRCIGEVLEINPSLAFNGGVMRMRGFFGWRENAWLI